MKASKIVTAENASTVKLVIEYIMGAPRIVDPIAERLYMLSTAVEEVEKQAEAEMLDVPTWKRRYLEGGGTYCPTCGFKNVDSEASPHNSSGDSSITLQNMRCIDCGARWRDWFKLADVEMLPSARRTGLAAPPREESE